MAVVNDEHGVVVLHQRHAPASVDQPVATLVAQAHERVRRRAVVEPDVDPGNACVLIRLAKAHAHGHLVERLFLRDTQLTADDAKLLVPRRTHAKCTHTGDVHWRHGLDVRSAEPSRAPELAVHYLCGVVAVLALKAAQPQPSTVPVVPSRQQVRRRPAAHRVT